MDEGYEDQYPVPQPSRRDKLRALEPPQTTTLAHNSQSLYYDPTTYNCNNLTMMPNFSFNNNTGPPHHQQHGNSIYDLTNQYHLSLAHNNSTTTNSHALCLSLSYCQKSCNDDNVARTTSCIPLVPFTGYASILKGSRFLKPAQQLLQELCFLGTTSTDHDHPHDDASFVHPSSFDTFSKTEDHSFPCVDGHKSLLISMLDEVLRSCKQYYQQMQAVLASFETVAGLSNAAPYANLALKTMSKHFNNMKNAISDQLAKAHSHPTTKGKDEAPTAAYGQRLDQTLGLFNEHQPVWRPQRGLPERAVSILKAWLFEHFLHPYPTDSDKIMLAKQTGLSRSQVSNWFINARVRLWKPMVEEIHALEMRQAQKTSSREERNDNSSNRPSDSLHSANSLTSDNPSTSSTQRFQENNPYKRNRNEYNLMHMGSNEQVSVAYNSMTSHLTAYSGGSGGVSLTLGLHQNNVISLAEPYHHINAAQRFGLGSDITSGVYVADGYEATNRHYGGYGIGGQPEFVGASYI